MRVAVLHEDRCQPKKCQNECYNFCPPVRNGVEVITWRKDNKPIVSEPLCIGCGICVHKCPHDALTIVNLPDEQEKDTVHRYGMNEFRLFGLPAPEQGKPPIDATGNPDDKGYEWIDYEEKKFYRTHNSGEEWIEFVSPE